ncbi:uncharacterized protein Sh3beta [Epargyreus clarus]|uniref:uncharacterized protein Sh3beta n=1 Tax=Epargyreus clarus TaxID=520877 RepID=UPI003C2ADA38
MVVKVYISGISGNKEVKKRQQRVLMILDSKNIKYDVIDITEPGRESDKDFMQNNAKSNGGTVSDPNPRSPLPPQVFNDEEYCGDYDQFDLANEVDTLEQFLKVEVPPEQSVEENALNGEIANKQSKENSQEKESTEVPAEKEKSPAREEESTTEKVSNEDTTSQDNTTPVEDVKPENESEEKDAVERQKSVDKEEATTEKEPSPVKECDVEAKKSSKDSSPVKEDAVNENGTTSSREVSQEKEANNVTEKKTDDPSEALIQSEQVAASD